MSESWMTSNFRNRVLSHLPESYRPAGSKLGGFCSSPPRVCRCSSSPAATFPE